MLLCRVSLHWVSFKQVDTQLSNTRCNCIQYNAIQHNDPQNKWLLTLMTLSINHTDFKYIQHNATQHKRHSLSNCIMLSVIMLNVLKPSAIADCRYNELIVFIFMLSAVSLLLCWVLLHWVFVFLLLCWVSLCWVLCLHCYAVCRCAECCVFIVMPFVIMLSIAFLMLCWVSLCWVLCLLSYAECCVLMLCWVSLCWYYVMIQIIYRYSLLWNIL